jgi:hypothetical protein
VASSDIAATRPMAPAAFVVSLLAILICSCAPSISHGSHTAQSLCGQKADPSGPGAGQGPYWAGVGPMPTTNNPLPAQPITVGRESTLYLQVAASCKEGAMVSITPPGLVKAVETVKAKHGGIVAVSLEAVGSGEVVLAVRQAGQVRAIDLFGNMSS